MEKKKRILVVDDEENMRHMLAVMLRKQGYAVDMADNGSHGLEKAIAGKYDFILCDIRMPVMDGAAFLQAAAGAGVRSTIIMMSAYGTMETALECMKMGAYDYVSKPFRNDEIVLVLRKAVERERLKAENERLKKEILREYRFGDIVSKSPRMQEIYAQIRKVCEHKTTVMVLGESGTGKELIARAIHSSGTRRRGPFVAVNCAAIPENLMESELFGHAKGAFTDAVADKAGLFEQADRGTLFLDEVGEMPLSLQVKLLRVLQDEEIRRVGGQAPIRVDVRVVSATSRNLDEEVRQGRFREDLFYRLNVFAINVPPLRERPEDIPLLVEHFLGKFGEKLGKPGIRPSVETLRCLGPYSWPGNVRELENCIERALILCEGDTLEVDCLPEVVRGGAAASTIPQHSEENLSLKRAGEALEREYISRALAVTGGNKTRAAKLLEISLRGLIYKMKEYGME
ncbi:MAG: sigma-54-dependent Fis family transcriptional regulator [Geobacter sp.]|nr:sigma-54-dependent Fis family transcriptional regulator [Geobacter sp.]